MATLAPTTGLSLRQSRAGQDVAAAESVSFLDLDFAPLALDAVLKLIDDRPAQAPFAYVVTPNVDHMVRIQRQRSDLWPAYRSAWLCLCDSRILAGLAALTGLQLPAVPGSDLTAALMARYLRAGDRIAVVGGSSRLMAWVRAAYSMAEIVHLNPPMGFAANAQAFAEARDFVIRARARFTIIAVGSPQQELLAWHVARSRDATGIGLCVGASLEFLAGEQRRAPGWMQALSLEWFYRLATNPRRLWRRYLVEGPKILSIYRRWRARRDRRTWGASV